MASLVPRATEGVLWAFKNHRSGSSLMVHAITAKDLDSIPGQGTKIP